jgi:hypothetical protein
VAATASGLQGAGTGSRLEALEAEVARLRQELDRLWDLTGLEDRREL